MLPHLSLLFTTNRALLCSIYLSFPCSFFLSLSLPRVFVTVARSSRMKEHESFLYLTHRDRGRVISCPTRTLFSSAVRDGDKKIISTLLSRIICAMDSDARY